MLREPQGDVSIALVGNTYRHETFNLKTLIEHTETLPAFCFLLR